MKRALCAALAACAVLCGCGAPKGELVEIQNGKQTVEILFGQSTSDAGSEEMMDALLRERFPDVDFEWTCVDWGESLTGLMAMKYAADELPDILIGKSQDVRVYKEMNAISPIAAEAGKSIDRAELALTTLDGELYGLPYNSLLQGVLYNKRVFRKLNIQPPQTINQLQNAVAICEKAGITPFAEHFQLSWPAANILMQLFVNSVFDKTPDWGERFRAGERDFATDADIRACFEQLLFIKEHSFADCMQIDQSECDLRFANGEAAMYMTGTWSLQTIGAAAQDIELGIFPYPNADGNAKLIRETNMTFMKGSGGEKPVVDEVLAILAADRGLAGEISDYTQAISTLETLDPYEMAMISADAKEYEKKGGAVNAEAGNSQLVWSFQSAIAEKTLEWLNGEAELMDVLRFADASRTLS